MSLLSRFFHRRPPDGLLELVNRVYVFDSCFSTEVLPEGIYQLYLHEIITELHEDFPESSFLAINFREGEKMSQFAEILCEYDVTVMDYPHQYEGCPLLPLSFVHHFLHVCETWLSIGSHQNIVLLHCERGGWPLLAFLLAGFLVYRKLHSGERKTLEFVHREAPKGLLQLLSSLNPFPSQIRYLKYISRRSISLEWPPPERASSLDCLILRAIPKFDKQNGCRPTVRIFGRNVLSKGGLSTKMLFSMPRKSRSLRHYRQKESDVIKIDIQCLVQGDVVLECVHLDLDPEREVMMFRIMFNTAFIRSNILILNTDNLDILWDTKSRYPKGFRAEVLFGEVDSISPPKAPISILNGEEKGGLPIEAFSMVKELFSRVEWVDNGDAAALCLLKQLSVLNDVRDLSILRNRMSAGSSPFDSEDENNASSTADSLDFLHSDKVNYFTYAVAPGLNFLDDPFSQDTASDQVSDSKTSEDQLSLMNSINSIPSLTEIEVQSVLNAALTTSNQIPPCPPPAPPSSSLLLVPDSAVSHTNVQQPLLAHSEPVLDDYHSKTPPPPPRPFISFSGGALPPAQSPSLSYTIVHQPHLPPPPPYPYKSTREPTCPPPPPIKTSSGPPPPPTPIKTCSGPPCPPPPPPPPLSSRILYLPPPPSSLLGSSIRDMSIPSLPSTSKGLLPPPPSISAKSSPPPPPPPPSIFSTSPPPPSPPPPSISSTPSISSRTPPPPPPPPPPPSPLSSKSPPPAPPLPPVFPISFNKPPLPPPPPLSSSSSQLSQPALPPLPPPPSPSSGTSLNRPPPPPPPPKSNKTGSAIRPPPPPCPPGTSRPGSIPSPPPNAPNLPNAPPPPPSRGAAPDPPYPPLPGSKSSNAPPLPPLSIVKGRSSFGSASRQVSPGSSIPPKKTSLKPLHWVKVTRAMQGSLWADSQKLENQSRAPEIDVSELESLFSAASASESTNKTGNRRGSKINKPDRVQLVDLRRAYNCEIMLTKIKIPLSDMINAILALDSSALDIDQVENLIKFCPTKEEMETLKNYTGDKDMLGKCEQFFLELMKVPRVESKLRVFSFQITFSSQVNDLRRNLNIINDASREVKESVKLRQIMQTILTLGNALNQGTARGSAVGFKLDSLLKLSDTRARNNKMTLMHYLCKLLAEKMPELLDFDKNLVHLEAASKIQLKSLAEEMQAVSKGLEKVELELTASENDGAISVGFQKALKIFLDTAETEVKALITLYSEAGRNADTLSQYFGEDPARCPFEQVTQILVVFIKIFKKSREDNEQQAEAEKKKLEKEALKEQAANNFARKEAVDVNLHPETRKMLRR